MKNITHFLIYNNNEYKTIEQTIIIFIKLNNNSNHLFLYNLLIINMIYFIRFKFKE